MQDVIEMLLRKQSTLEADKEAEKAAAVERIENEYAERSARIDALLDMAGYVKPVVEEVDAKPEATAEAADVEKDVTICGL